MGREFALRYAKPGTKLFLTDVNESSVRATAEMCTEKGAVCMSKNLDVCDRDAQSEWIKRIVPAEGIDLAIANAGIAGPSLQPCSVEDRIHKVLDVNVMGVSNTICAVLPGMRTRKKGQILIVASLAAFGVNSRTCSYMASKSAAYKLGLQLRGLVKQSGVYVNVACPGFAHTNMTKPVENKIPMPFIISASEMAEKISDELAIDTPVICHPLPTTLCSIAGQYMTPSLAQFVNEILFPVPESKIDIFG